MTMQSRFIKGSFDYDAKAQLAFLCFCVLCISVVIILGFSLGQAAYEKRKEVREIQKLINSAKSISNDEFKTSQEKLFTGDNLAEIQSSLQEKVKDIGENYNIEIDNIQALDPETEGSLLINKIRVGGAIPERYFAPFLLELAESKPSIFILDVDIRPVPVRAARVDITEAATPKLSVQLVLSGLSNSDSAFNLR